MTMIWLLVAGVLVGFAAALLARVVGRGPGSPGRWIPLVLVGALLLAFGLWLAFMVLDVGPTMRGA